MHQLMSEVTASLIMPSRSRRAQARQQLDRLHALLEKQIDEGRVRPGERLATERELAEQFGASRSVVRQALAELGKAGKIIRRVGHGTIVAPLPDAGLPRGPRTLQDASPLELLEFRLALEPGLAEPIVLNASEADIRSIAQCLEAGDKASDWSGWEHWDRSFHRCLVAATHNRLAIAVYDVILAIRHERPWLRLKQGHTNAAKWEMYQSEHRQILAAIAERNATGAANAMRRHLANVRAKMLGM
jgi:DNA-binding FadR family transcriptional regulator